MTSCIVYLINYTVLLYNFIIGFIIDYPLSLSHSLSLSLPLSLIQILENDETYKLAGESERESTYTVFIRIEAAPRLVVALE